MSRYVFDIETDGLNPTVVHVISMFDLDTGEATTYNPDNIDIGAAKLNEAELLIGHNIINFDIPVLERLCSAQFTPDKPRKVIDTLVLSQLCYSDILPLDTYLTKVKGIFMGKLMKRHSLEAWGVRLGEHKGDFKYKTDWATWSPEMSTYCAQDVKVSTRVYNALMATVKSKEIPESVIDLEMRVAQIVKKQALYGFYFDERLAEQKYSDFMEVFENLKVWFKQRFPDKREVIGYYKRDNVKRGIKAGDPKIKVVPFNPGSAQHVAGALLKLGWKPSKFTDAGNIKLDKAILDSLESMFPELIGKVQEYRDVQKLLGYLGAGENSWLHKIKDHRLHGAVNSCGAATHRMTHSDPNLAQIPAHSELGKSMRELFTVPPGKVLVGCDAKALELRVLAHYLYQYDGGIYVDTIKHGDIHNANKEAAGIEDRGDAKRFTFAFIYGAGDTVLGAKARPGITDEKELNRIGKKLRALFLKNTKGLRKLQRAIQDEAESHFIRSLDNRVIFVSAKYKAMNYLIQSSGAIVMKQALVCLYDRLAELGLKHGVDYAFVANVHDEWQIETTPELADQVASEMRNAIIKAGEVLGMHCPMDAEAKIGKNWAETH